MFSNEDENLILVQVHGCKFVNICKKCNCQRNSSNWKPQMEMTVCGLSDVFRVFAYIFYVFKGAREHFLEL